MTTDTITVRFYPRDRPIFQQGELDEAHILRLLLDNKHSYYVPIYMNYGPSWRYLDLQFGPKPNSSLPIEHVVETYSKSIDRAWVRSSYRSDGDDYIFYYDSERLWREDRDLYRRCQYGIDRIKIYTQNPPDEKWQADGEAWSYAIEGSYCTLNSRSTLVERLCPLSTLTTLTGEGDKLSGIMPGNFQQIYYTLPKELSRIEYLWNGRVVRASFPGESNGYSKDPWIEYSIDYWDNCVDERYLEYHNSRAGS
jgi:hypothetical protein